MPRPDELAHVLLSPIEVTAPYLAVVPMVQTGNSSFLEHLVSSSYLFFSSVSASIIRVSYP